MSLFFVQLYISLKAFIDFKTFIPSEDQLIIERLLGRKLDEYEDERQKIMAENKDTSSKNVLNT